MNRQRFSIYACMNCVNGSSVYAEAGSEVGARLGVGETESGLGGTAASKAAVLPGSADAGAGVRKFTLEEVALLERVSSRVRSGLSRLLSGPSSGNTLSGGATRGSPATI